MRSADDRILANSKTPADFRRRKATVGPKLDERRIALRRPAATRCPRCIGYCHGKILIPPALGSSIAHRLMLGTNGEGTIN
jgi:hypothetical protein